MKKNDLRCITRFIPALDSGELCEWGAEAVTEKTVSSAAAPVPEYWDVVYRFSEAVLDLAERTDAAPGNEEESTDSVIKAAIDTLAAMIKAEEGCPGVLIGYIKNGTLLRILKRLDSLAEQLPD